MSSSERGGSRGRGRGGNSNNSQRGRHQQHRPRHDNNERRERGDAGQFQSSRNGNRPTSANPSISAPAKESKGIDESSGSSSSDSDFLLSGAEKREKALRKQAQKDRLDLASQRSAATAEDVDMFGNSNRAASSSSTANSASASSRAPPQLPGYYFDAQQNKYFKLLPSHIHTAAAGLDADDDSSILNQGSGRGLHAALALGKQMLQRAQQRIPIHTNPAKQSGRSSDKGRKHLTCSAEEQDRRKRVKYDTRVSTSDSLSASCDAADSTANRSWSHAIHRQQGSRSILSSLVNREMRSTIPGNTGIPAQHMLSPVSLLQSRLPSLLTPVPFPFMRLQYLIDASRFPSTEAAIRAQIERDYDSADISGEHALAYDARAGLLSIAGNRSHIPTRLSEAEAGEPVASRSEQTMRGQGTAHVTMRISENMNRYDRRILEALSSASDASSTATSRARLKDFELQRRLNPFRMRCVSMFEADSPITSIHRIHSWSPISHPQRASAAATARGAPLVFDSVRRFRERRRAEWIRGEFMHDTTNMWSSESERVAQQEELNSESVQNLIGYTLFGGKSPGSFHLCMEDFHADQLKPSEPQALFSHSVTNGSCWTSALPRSMRTNSLHGLRVSLGCTKRGFVVDLITGARTTQIESNKSDILSQTWITQGDSDSNLLLNGSRDGMVRSIDVRKRASDNSSWRKDRSSSSSSGTSESLPSIRMSSSVCWLQQMETNPNHVLAAAVDGQLAAYDIRCLSNSSTNSATSPILTTPILSYLGHKNTFSQLIPTIDPSESHLYCGGQDGVVRAWDLKTTELVLEKSPLRQADLQTLEPSSSAGFSVSSAGRRLIEWKQVLFLEEFDTLLAGAEAGVAAMNLVRRQLGD